MNKNLYTLYVAIIDNSVVCIDTNLKLFVDQFNAIIPGGRNYDWFYRKFKKESKFSFSFDNNRTYFFEKIC